MHRHQLRLPALLAAAALLSAIAPCQQTPVTANYRLAQKYSDEFLRKFTYDTAVAPQWIGDSELFWYRFRTAAGTRYWLVDPIARTKALLFDHERMAARLSEAAATPLDAANLDLRGLKLDDTGEEMTFTVEGHRFVYRRSKDELEHKGKQERPEPTEAGRGQDRGGREQGSGQRRELTEREKQKAREERRKRLLADWKKRLEEHDKQKEQGVEQEEEQEREQEQEQQREGRSRRGAVDPGSPFSPDLTRYVFARRGNLFVAERTGEPSPPAAPTPEPDAANGSRAVAATAQKTDTETGDDGAAATTTDTEPAAAKAAPAPIVFPFDEAAAHQLSADAEADYGFGGDIEDDEAVPASVVWAKDSSAFYVSRRDQRGVAELFLVDSLADPRPALQQYKYPMPGEENIRSAELMVYTHDGGALVRVEPRWPDESYVDVRWLESGELRVARRDRTMRHVEYGTVDPKTGAFTVLFAESVTKGNLITQRIRYLEDRGQLIWWSERSGWGHYYLYGLDGKLVNPITTGSFRASRIVDVDEKKGVLWFAANGREPGENVYYEHLYRVRLDGDGVALLDPGDATHRSTLSKSRRFLVDNSSRVDLTPTAMLRDGDGAELMPLETADLSQLEALGWRPPERFTVKAADGVTELYGNMWKPFDFDPARKYPLIVHVYPGPQQEGVTHTFSATGSRQELAQLGFVVIQVGHRGGTPTRSKAYGSYGYFNMRDYGLEDKKTAIEQLAARHDYIDIDRIGIYGHSGGGFMTAAALLKEPYNEFFKVGVATAGNHDNNIYNNSWAERYHGLAEVEQKEKTERAARGRGGERKQGEGDKSGTGEKQQVEGGKSDTGEKQQGEGGKTETGEKQQGQGDKTETGEKKQGQGDKTETGNKEQSEEEKARYNIKVATNAELAPNLEGKLLLIHGEIDNNVHPAGTMRLVDALIKANKRFDMLIIPGARHSFGRASEYAKHRTWDYFVEHLLGERHTGADIREKDGYRR